MSGKKLTKMRSIVRHWKKLTNLPQSRYSSLSGDKEEFSVRSDSCFSLGGGASCDSSDLESSPKSVKHLARSAVTDGVPEGNLALFVGRERRKFVIGAHYLEHNLFRDFLSGLRLSSGSIRKAESQLRVKLFSSSIYSG